MNKNLKELRLFLCNLHPNRCLLFVGECAIIKRIRRTSDLRNRRGRMVGSHEATDKKPAKGV